MKKSKAIYHRHRFPAAVISCAVRWYFRFQLILRDIEELLLERGVVISYEAIRRWCDKFGKQFAQRVRQARPMPGPTGHLDEVFVKVGGELYLLWRRAAQGGPLRKRRNAAMRRALLARTLRTDPIPIRKPL